MTINISARTTRTRNASANNAIDLSRPSFNGARYLAREAAIKRMRDAGRTRPDATDEEFIRREQARLLWHVAAVDGGFDGLVDAALEDRARRLALPLDYVSAGHWSPGEWPAARVAA